MSKKKQQVKKQIPIVKEELIDKIHEQLHDELNNDYKTNETLPADGNCDKCSDGGCIWDLGEYYICGHCNKKFKKNLPKRKTMKEMEDNETIIFYE